VLPATGGNRITREEKRLSYWRVYYHLIWATYQRTPWLTSSLERLVYGTLLSKASELSLIIHQIGNTDDHIHLIASIPPKISIAECVRHLKGATSHYVNKQRVLDEQFSWQDGYGVISFGERPMATLVAYVKNQRIHHAQGKAIALYERMAQEDDGPAGA
jgi:putative transposase